MVEGLAVDLVHLDGSAVVMLRGEIDVASSAVFSSAMEQSMLLGVPVVLDFAGVTFMDSSGLNVLLHAQKTDPPDFVCVRNPPDQVRRLLAVTGLDRMICTVTNPISGAAESESDATFDNGSNR